MAAIIETAYIAGATIYAHIRNEAGAVWNGSAFEAYNASNYSTYDVALSEDGSCGYYKVSLPAIGAGKYTFIIYDQASGAPAEGDQVIGTGSIMFDGTDQFDGLPTTISDQIWDEARSGHVADGTFGQMLQAIRTATAAGGASGTITLDASASGTDDFYNNCIVQIIGGTGANQSRIISDYTGSSKVADVNDNWVTSPDNTSVFVITPFGSIPGASAPTAAQNADAVWDEARAGHVGAGSFGEGVLAEDINTAAKASVNAEVDTALSDVDLDHLIKTTYGGANPTIGSLIDVMINKNSGQTFDQSTDSLEAIKDLGNGPSTGQIADAVWDEALGTGAHDTANSAGERVKAIDDKLPSSTISDFDETSDNVNLNADQSGITIGTVDALGTTAKSEVNAEVVDALGTDTMSQIASGAPTATPTLKNAIMYLYMALINKQTQTGSELAIYNNAGTKIAKATVSDNGITFTKDNFGTP